MAVVLTDKRGLSQKEAEQAEKAHWAAVKKNEAALLAARERHKKRMGK